MENVLQCSAYASEGARCPQFLSRHSAIIGTFALRPIRYSIVVTVDFSNYGQPVTITIPPASDVKDFSASNLGALSGAFSKSGH